MLLVLLFLLWVSPCHWHGESTKKRTSSWLQLATARPGMRGRVLLLDV